MSRLTLSLLAPLLLAPLLAFAESPSVGTDSPLDRYVQKEQPSYTWSVKSTEKRPDGVRWVRFALTSQTWRGIVWKHRLNLVVPPAATGKRARPEHAILLITGTGGEDEHLMIVSGLALRLGVPIAVLHDTPNQPLFRKESGRRMKEDALIAYTFMKFIETGEEDWPLLFPMVRSAVSAMDALGEYSAQQRQDWKFGRLEKFVTTGASKRGWTTWLSSVVDQRVIGIAPIVYDNLNIKKQLALHYETWGKPSPSIHDYTDAGLLKLIDTKRGKALFRMVDPYSYRDRITVPTMAMIGTNDTYWPLQAVNVYRHDLKTNLFTHYVPNAGHSAGLSVLAAVAGFFDHVTHRTKALPEVRLSILPRRSATLAAFGKGKLRVKAVRLWGSHVDGKDFTKSKWTRVAAVRTATGWEAPLPKPTIRSKGQAAFIGEFELRDSKGERFMIHSAAQVWDLGKGPSQK
ncbi:MAG: hypothetical protein JKY65_04500 [Planctomycetes bacterium]|nr:hypothetical protein [Planctomycetota bacterium]